MALQVDTYIAPIIHANTSFSDPLKQQWSPISCTAIHTATSVLLVDTPITITETENFADWIETTLPGKEVKYFFPSHGHGDHFFGLPVLQKRFPGIKAIATTKVIEGMKEQYSSPTYDTWSSWFPHQLPAEKPLPEPLPSTNEIDLDGHIFHAYDVQHGDADHNSFLHVPELDLVVAGDLIYGDCYAYLAEANTKETRAEWLRAIDQLESLKPNIVIPGHKRTSQVDGAYLIGQTREYIQTWETALEAANSSVELYQKMKEVYPRKWNDFILQISSDATFAKKGM